MEPRKLCAYNRTRECFLGLEVFAADLSAVEQEELMGALRLKSGEGLWLMPFRGSIAATMPEPVDLIYLDAECRAIETVESFPTSRGKFGDSLATSVLVTPAHSIYSSQTQPGDQLVVCAAEEMSSHLDRLERGELIGIESRKESRIESAVLLREEPLWSGGPGVIELERRTAEPEKLKLAAHEMELAEPEQQKRRVPKNWLQRWWSPDPRKAPREDASGLAAYYWNGAPPEPHPIRNISFSGLYVETEERWYPGTLVLMTLQKTEAGVKSAERSISVHCRAVRWGKDGVGMQFVLADERNARGAENAMRDGADRRDLDRFLEDLRRTRR